MYKDPARQKERIQTEPAVFFKVLYNNQKTSSKRRKHPPPSYTYDELIEWLKLQPNLTQIWQDYQNSKWARNSCPSLDRLDDNLPYSLSNIRLTTWKDNLSKSRKDMRYGKLNQGKTKAIPVIQLTKDGAQIAEYPSYAAAEEATGVFSANIRAVCLGEQSHAKGTFWRIK